MSSLPLEDLKINPSSYVDPNGFVFQYKNELLRAIFPEREEYYRSLFQKGVIEHLSKNFKLVDSSLTDHTIPELNCNLVIRHKKIYPLNYCVEWCPSMLKKAAITTLELNLELLREDSILQDAYPWNIVYDSTQPVFVDLTSLAPSQTPLLWPAYQQFIHFFLNPLELNEMGKGKTARALLFDHINGISNRDLILNLNPSYMLSHPLKLSLKVFLEKISNALQKNVKWKLLLQEKAKTQNSAGSIKKIRKRFLEGLLKKANKICFPGETGNWENYYKDLEGSDLTESKSKTVRNILASVKPKTVLDLGCNIGKYSLIAAEQGAQVTSIDSSEPCIETLFKIAEKENHKILPLICDILNPTPPFGFLPNQFPSFVDRLKSDVILCLGLMHHLHINGRQSFDRIARLLNELSNKAVIFEYVDVTDGNIKLLDHGRKIEYCLESVSNSLEKFFNIQLLESDRETRRILLCTKRSS